jgi:glucoamylase
MRKIFLSAVTLVVSAAAVAANQAPTFEEQIATQQKRSYERLLPSISPKGTARGVIIASPSRGDRPGEPDYYFHWTRDAALVMTSLSRESQMSAQDFESKITDYAQLSRWHQIIPNLCDNMNNGRFGEPKFEVDGRPFKGGWGRPQNDGPALRSVVMAAWAQKLIDAGQTDYVKQVFYRDGLNADPSFPYLMPTLIKSDLEYVAHNWHRQNFDLWEEADGDHLYTRLVQRRAMLEGAALAERLNDKGAGDWYRAQAQNIEAEMDQFWNADGNYLWASRGLRFYRTSVRKSHIDAAVVLAALHARPTDPNSNDTFMTATDSKILATAAKIERTFEEVYVLNKRDFSNDLGTAIGRYPEDTYDGVNTNGTGNPWFLLTSAFAELHYRAAVGFIKAGEIKLDEHNHTFLFRALDRSSEQRFDFQKIGTLRAGSLEFKLMISALVKRGDAFLNRVLRHADQETGALSEQFNRDTGLSQGARDLTWSHAAFLTAMQARSEVKSAIAGNKNKVLPKQVLP